MMPEELRDIVRELVRRSEDGSIEWEQSRFGLSDDRFRASVGRYTAVIEDTSLLRLGDTEPTTLRMSIHDALGEEIISFTVESGDQDYRDALHLYQSARALPRRTKEALSDLRRQLGLLTR